MFNINLIQSFKCSKTKEDIYQIVKTEIMHTAVMSINQNSGKFSLYLTEYESIGFVINAEGKIISKDDGRYSVNLDVVIKPLVTGWLIAILLFPIGLLIFIKPNNVKKELQKRLENHFSEINLILNEN